MGELKGSELKGGKKGGHPNQDKSLIKIRKSGDISG
jgi:hypothetical protein